MFVYILKRAREVIIGVRFHFSALYISSEMYYFCSWPWASELFLPGGGAKNGEKQFSLSKLNKQPFCYECKKDKDTLILKCRGPRPRAPILKPMFMAWPKHS